MIPPISEEEQIAELAYRIFQNEGCPDGLALEHWSRAERAIREQRIGVRDTESPSAGATENPNESTR